jgi:hypothetical protein
MFLFLFERTLFVSILVGKSGTKYIIHHYYYYYLLYDAQAFFFSIQFKYKYNLANIWNILGIILIHHNNKSIYYYTSATTIIFFSSSALGSKYPLLVVFAERHFHWQYYMNRSFGRCESIKASILTALRNNIHNM